jgi:predicted small lipoprotein YifL
MSVRFTFLIIAAVMIAACGRQGAMLRPEPGVTVMKEADKPAEPAVDKPFILDGLIK